MENEFNTIREKIKKLDKEMKKTWNSKKIEKIYEEILPINNNFYYITTFVHIDNSLTEKILCFQQFTNTNIQVVNQIKNYENINEYKKNIVLIEDSSINNNCQCVSIKDFLEQQKEKRLKPSKTEFTIWGTSHIVSLGVPVTLGVAGIIDPGIARDLREKIIVGLISVTIGLFIKSVTSTVSTAIKKVDSWFYSKRFKNQEQKDKDKKEYEAIIEKLTSDKTETRLKTQFKILKQELDNSKNKKTNELINDEIINHNSNIKLLHNIDNFDSSIKNTINNQDQPSTSTGIYHSNLIG